MGSAAEKNKLPFQRSRRRAFPFVIIMACSALTAVLLLIALNIFLENEMYNERSSHLEEITVSSAGTLDTMITSAWEHTELLGSLLSHEKLSDADDLISSLKRLNSYYPLEDSLIAAVDSEGTYYCSDGSHGVWGRVFHRFNKFTDRSISITSEPENEQMIFSQRMDEPFLTESGLILTHVALLRSMSALESEFCPAEDGKPVTMCFVDSAGDIVYSNGEFAMNGTSWNINQAMSRHKIVRGASADDFEAAVYSGTPECLEFSYNGSKYFTCCVPVCGNGWRMAVFVGESALSRSTDSIVKPVVSTVTVISVLAVSSVAAAAVLMVNNADAHRYIRTQEELNRRLSEEAQTAENAAEQKSRYFSRITHDFRTPINGIIGMADMAEKNCGDPEKVRHCLANIRSSSGHLLSLVNDVLDMRRMEKGEVSLNTAPVDILRLLDECCAVESGQLLGRRLSFQRDFSGIEHPNAMCSALRLKQILINILGNAVKFTPDGGSIRFSAHEEETADGRRYSFIVSDTGIGMSEEFQRVMFMPFAREHETSRNPFSGTGLGMAIVKQLVELMNGDITVRSKTGEGTEITVSLIMKEPPEIRRRTAEKVLSGMKILAAEDNLVNMEIIRYNLEECGAHVIPAENGREAAELFAQSRCGEIEVILMDLRMPVMNGTEAARLIRSMQRSDAGSVRIIALTGSTRDEDIRQAAASGMNEHFEKPVDIQRLIMRLSEIHDENAASAMKKTAV